MNIFIIGETNSGKSTLARYIQKIKGYDIVSAGFFMKENYPQKDNENKKEYTDRLTGLTLEFLKEDTNFFFNKIKNKINKTKSYNVIIEGIRNPRDFIFLFNPEEDVVIHTNLAEKYNNDDDEVLFRNLSVSTEFEKLGIEAIKSICNFYKKINEPNIFEVTLINHIDIDLLINFNGFFCMNQNENFYEYINKTN